MIKEFVKRQDRVCALQWDGTEERLKQMLTLVRCVPQVNFKKSRPPMRMPQPNGTFQYVQVGDWVVRDDAGNISVLPDPMFKMRYRPVEDGTPDVSGECCEMPQTVVEPVAEPAPVDAHVELVPGSEDPVDKTPATEPVELVSGIGASPVDESPEPEPKRKGRPPKGGK